MSVIFPDPVKTIVSGLVAALEARTEPVASEVYVATKMPPASLVPYPSKIVTIRSDGGPKLDEVRQFIRIGVNVYADTYADASELAYLVDALAEDLRGEQIKMVTTVLSPTRVPEDSEQEHRYLTWEIITKGSTL
jgi:hypothetical protein